MKRVYVIGSLTKEKEIYDTAMFIKLNGDFDVHYVKKRPGSQKILIEECFDEIEKADVVIAMEKSNFVFGNGTMYEIEYARRCKKIVLYTDGRHLSGLFIRLCLVTSSEKEIPNDRWGSRFNGN